MATFPRGVRLLHIYALNSFHETIKFTAEISETSVNFLDTKVSKDENGRITTDLYTKPTDSHLYLHYSSFHPKHQKQSLPYSQALRIQRICSNDTLFKAAAQNLISDFIMRGYPTKLVKNTFERAGSMNRDNLLQPQDAVTQNKQIIPCIITHNPSNPPINIILSKYRRILETSEELQPVTNCKTLIVYKRAANFKQLLVRAAINTEQTDKGSSPCGKPCITCPFMQKTDHVTSWKTKEQFEIKGRFNCKTKNAIYVINCKKCGLQYVGQTGNTFNERFRGHLTDIRQGNDVKPVSRHFTSANHTTADVNAIIVAQTTNNLNQRLRTEQTWIYFLRTKTPSGLNLIQ